MNKVLHFLVWAFLVLAGAALFFELQLNDKRSELTDRNRMQEDYFIKIAKTIEEASPAKDAAFEIKKDVSPVEAKEVDSPDMENVLEGYQAVLEQAQLKTYEWGSQQRDALRRVYALDADGKPLMDGNQPQTRDSDEEKLLEKLFESAKTQQTRLNSTRAALTDLRGKLEGVVNELNKLKPEARQDKVTIDSQREKMAKLEEEKTALEGQVTKIKGQITELNGEISSKNDEITTLKDEVEAAKAETAKMVERNERLTKMLQESIQTRGAQSQDSVGLAVTSLPAGTKGVITVVDNENMFAIVKFDEPVMKELKGENLDKPLPMIELGVKRPGFNGAAGEFVGRIRLRQEIKGKNYVICDILGAWEQAKLAVNDVLFAD